MGAPSKWCREPLGIDVAEVIMTRRVRARGQEPLQVTEDEIDIEAALVSFVDDDRVVVVQPWVAVQLGQQNPVGHDLHQGAVADPIGEPDLVTH